MSKHFSKSFRSLFFLARAFLLTATFYVSGVLNGDRLFAEECWVWFGTYSQGNTGSEGIYGATIHLESGAITKPILAAKAVNPSFLALHPTRPLLYAVSEIADRDGMPTGGITAFSIDNVGNVNIPVSLSINNTLINNWLFNSTGVNHEAINNSFISKYSFELFDAWKVHILM